MKKNTGILLLVLSLILISYQLQAQQGYNMDITIKGYPDTTAILGHYFGPSLYPDDTVHFNSKGQGLIKGKKELPGGMYVLLMPDGKYFEFILGSDLHFSLEADSVDFIQSLQFKGADDNQLFADFQRYMLEKQDAMKELQDEFAAATGESEKKSIREEINSLNDERINRIHEISKNHPDYFTGTFLEATLDVNVPDEISDDQTKAYYYYKAHYFDNFNLSDIRLAQTPLYEQKIKNFLDKVVPQVPDSLIKEIDFIIDKSKADSAIFRYVLITLFNKYAKSQIMGMDAVQVHIAEKYYIPDAWWSSEEFIEELKDRVAALNPLIIGKKAPDVELLFVPTQHFIDAESDTALKNNPHAGTLKQISTYTSDEKPADIIVLIFWEATCSHCKKIVPEMYQIYQDSLKSMGVRVIAISTLFGVDGKQQWIDFVNKHKLYDWENAWNPYSYDYKLKYDIRSTPQIFVINKDIEIIGKRLGPENITDLIKAYKKYNIKE